MKESSTTPAQKHQRQTKSQFNKTENKKKKLQIYSQSQERRRMTVVAARRTIHLCTRLHVTMALKPRLGEAYFCFCFCLRCDCRAHQQQSDEAPTHQLNRYFNDQDDKTKADDCA